MAKILQLNAHFSTECPISGEYREFHMTVSEQSKDIWNVEVEDLRTGEEWPLVRFKWALSAAPRTGASVALARAISVFEAHLKGLEPWEGN